MVRIRRSSSYCGASQLQSGRRASFRTRQSKVNRSSSRTCPDKASGNPSRIFIASHAARFATKPEIAAMLPRSSFVL